MTPAEAKDILNNQICTDERRDQFHSYGAIEVKWRGSNRFTLRAPDGEETSGFGSTVIVHALCDQSIHPGVVQNVKLEYAAFTRKRRGFGRAPSEPA